MDGITTFIMLLIAASFFWRVFRGGWPAIVGVFSLKHPFRRPEPGPPGDDPVPPELLEAFEAHEAEQAAPPRRLPFDDVPEARIGDRVILSQVTLQGNILAHGVTFTAGPGGSTTLVIDRLVAPAAGLEPVLASYNISAPRAMVMTAHGRRVTLHNVFLTERASWVNAHDMSMSERVTFMVGGFIDDAEYGQSLLDEGLRAARQVQLMADAANRQAETRAPEFGSQRTGEALTGDERARLNLEVLQLETQQRRERQRVSSGSEALDYSELNGMIHRHAQEWVVLLDRGRRTDWLRRLCEQAITRLGEIVLPIPARPVSRDFRGHPGYSSYTDQSLPPLQPPRPRTPDVRSIDLDGASDA